MKKFLVRIVNNPNFENLNLKIYNIKYKVHLFIK